MKYSELSFQHLPLILRVELGDRDSWKMKKKNEMINKLRSLNTNSSLAVCLSVFAITIKIYVALIFKRQMLNPGYRKVV